jgi:aspartate-semialdehyde dehydrogenase
MRKLNVAIVGATGLVGQEFIRILQQRRFPMTSLQLCASDRSHGKKIRFRDDDLEVKETTPDSFAGIDIALFSAGADISRQFSPIAARTGAVVVDNSAAFRMAPEVPLVVPEVNSEDIYKHHGIIANPNCSTIQMVVALFPLHKANPIKRVTVATYQSVSGTGSAATDELTTQSRLFLEGRETKPKVYPYQIAFNVLPEIDAFLEDGYTKEERKMAEETRKIMHAPDIAVSATCVRVPVVAGHSEAVHVEFAQPMPTEEARQILSDAPGVKLMDDPDNRLYPHPLVVAGQDAVYVGRIRKDASHANGLVLWIVGDNLRKGAALNAVQIAERLVPKA